MSDDNYINAAHRRFEAELETLGSIKNRRAYVFDTIDLEETPNPNINDFNQLKKIFISIQALSGITVLSNELGMVGRDGPDDVLSMTTTRHSVEYFAIFNTHIKQMTKLYSQRKYSQCFDKLLSIILGIKDYINGFCDTDCADRGQKILNTTTLIWRKLMVLNATLIGITEQEKRILFQVMNEIKNEIERFRYKFNVGSYQRPINHNIYNNDSDDDDDDDGCGSQNRSNTNQKRSRKRRLNQEEYDDDDNNDNKPKKKRQRINLHSNVVADDGDEDDEIEAYEMSELNGLNVKELKKLLKEQHFPVSGTKSKLIERLLYPKKTILEMKKSYHKKFPRGVRVPMGTSQRRINELLTEGNRFDPDLYVFIDGKIKKVSVFKRHRLGF